MRRDPQPGEPICGECEKPLDERDRVQSPMATVQTDAGPAWYVIHHGCLIEPVSRLLADLL